MSDNSKIEWTDATWNPFAGCAVLSPGCTNCYAMKMAARLDAMGQPLYKGLTKPSKAGAVWRGTIRRASDDVLLAPLRRRKPTTYFVNSMSDLFYETFPDEWIDMVLSVMMLTPQHTYQVLTKRAARMQVFMTLLHRAITKYQAELCGEKIDGPDVADLFPHVATSLAHPINHGRLNPLSNLWLGVSTERQKEADERIPLLLQTPAAVRFISAEPLLGPIDLTRMGIGGRGVNALGFYTNAMTGHAQHQIPALDWVIVGGESGHDARPMHPDWARSLRDQCKAASVPFFFKQWGEWGPSTPEQAKGNPRSGWCVHPEARAAFIEHFGKKAAGRLLDGAEHNATPVRP